MKGGNCKDVFSSAGNDNSKVSQPVPKVKRNMPKAAVDAKDMPAGPMRKVWKGSVSP